MFEEKNLVFTGPMQPRFNESVGEENAELLGLDDNSPPLHLLTAHPVNTHPMPSDASSFEPRPQTPDNLPDNSLEEVVETAQAVTDSVEDSRNNLAISSSATISKNDIGNYIDLEKDLDSETKYHLLDNCWEPDENYKFSKDCDGRKFCLHWLKNKDFKDWLSYSHIKEGAFCRICVLFLSCKTQSNNNLGLLVTKPLNEKTFRFRVSSA